MPGENPRLSDTPLKLAGRDRIVIYAAMDSFGQWTVRAYEDIDDGLHLWSSEQASSFEQGIREVVEGITRA